MESDPPLPIKNWTPPFVQPILRALDRMHQRETVTPDALTSRANDNLLRQLGSSRRVEESTFSHAVLGIAVDHTVLFGGFALLLPVRDGIAVSIRESEAPESRLVFEGDDYCWSFDATSHPSPTEDAPWWAETVMHVVRSVGAVPSQVDISVVSTVVPSCEESYGSALAVSTLRTLQSLFALALDDRELFAEARLAVEESTGRPCSVAYAIASDAAQLGYFIIADALTGRHMEFPVTFEEEAALGLIETGRRIESTADILERRSEEVVRITERLRKKGFPDLESIRDLEHKDLELAEKALSRSQRPILRHLVRENQRVHRLVVASRNSDWQLFGALMSMSHASLSRDFDFTTETVDRVVEVAEEHSADGIHGARALGTAGAVVVLGQPFVVPPLLDKVRTVLEEEFGITANTVLL
jgi:galactokinase